MQKYILKQQFKGFSVSNSEGLHKGYDRFQSLLSKLEIHGASVSTEDGLFAMRVVELKEIKIVGRRDAWKTLEIGMGRRLVRRKTLKQWVTIDGEVMLTKLKNLYDDAQREQLSDASIEIKAYTQDLDDKTDVLTYHKKLLAEAQKEKEDLKAKVEKWHNSSKNLSKLLNTQMSANDKFGLGYGDHRYDGILSYENEVLQSVFMNKEKPSELVSEPVVNEFNVESQPKVWSDAPIIEEYESDSEDEYVSIPTKEQATPSFANQQVKTPRETVKNQFKHNQKPKVNKKELG
ncbi:hypothetical protein Tco_1136013, partial [Tanacetum coccineum]